jgi:hypothetical protein
MSAHARSAVTLLVGVVFLAITQMSALACGGDVVGNGGVIECEGSTETQILNPAPQLTGELSTQNARALPAVSAEEVIPPPPPCTDVIAVGVPRSPDGQICRVRTAAEEEPPADGDPAEPDYQAIARQAALELIADKGSVGVLPGRALVGLETFYWIEDIEPLSATRPEDGWVMRIDIDPVAYTWDFGDGTRTTGGRGNPDAPQSGDVVHVYQHPGRYTSAATVDWQVTFNVDGGQTLAATGEFRTTVTAPVQVDQLRARLTR